ncbi:MAG: hypothetical protein ACPF97_07265 [Ilumatobacteraceae bacterium]
MMPAGLLWAIAAVLIVLRVVWWLAANDKICRGPSTHDAGVPIDLADCPSVVAAFALSGADGGACYLLEHAASAAVAELVESGVLKAQSNGDEAWISVGEPLNLASDDAMLVDMLSTRMSRSRDGSEVVDSGTLAHHPPRMMWWLRYRRAVANRSRAAGITEARSAFGVLIGITAVGGLIGAVGFAIGARSVISAVASLDPLALRLWWLVLGIAGGRIALDALHTSVERVVNSSFALRTNVTNCLALSTQRMVSVTLPTPRLRPLLGFRPESLVRCRCSLLVASR